ncbi:MAG: hypothetical protein AAGG72_08930, partial [Pseudomonadota bacterium]
LQSNTSLIRPETVVSARGGSAMLSAAQNATQGFWYDQPSATAGVNLTNAQSMLAAIPRRPLAGIWNQGEQDTFYVDDEAKRVAFRDSTSACLDLLRAAMNPSDASAVTFYLTPVGRREGLDTAQSNLGYNLVRHAHLEVIANNPRVQFGGEFYDVELVDGVHGTYAGYERMARRTADIIAAQFNTSHTPVLGPSIASATRQTTTTVDVAITLETGQTLVRPATADHFGVYTSAGVRLPVTGTAWTDNTVRLTVEGTLDSGGTLRYPDGNLGAFLASNVVRYAGVDRPLRSSIPLTIAEI